MINLGQALSSVFAGNKALRGHYQFTPQISETEQDLADTLNRHSKVAWHQQVPFETQFGTFYLDMGCRIASVRAIGVECDGHQFHQDRLRDFCRDCLMLGTGRVSCIYRLEAWAVRKRLIEWLGLLNELEPELFVAERTEAIRSLLLDYYQGTEDAPLARGRVFLTRLRAEGDAVREFLAFAGRNKGVRFSELVERFRQSEQAARHATSNG